MNKWIKAALTAAGFVLCIGIAAWAFYGETSIPDGTGGRTALVESRKHTNANMRVKGDFGTGAMLTMERFATGTTAVTFNASGAIVSAAAYVISVCGASAGTATMTVTFANQTAGSTNGVPLMELRTLSNGNMPACIEPAFPPYFDTGIWATATNFATGTLIYRLNSW